MCVHAHMHVYVCLNVCVYVCDGLISCPGWSSCLLGKAPPIYRGGAAVCMLPVAAVLQTDLMEPVLQLWKKDL